MREVAQSFENGLTTSNLGKPNYNLTCKQHQKYVEALKKCGLMVTELTPEKQYPDSTFVEDPAIVTERCAIITSPGALSRRGEEVKIREVLGTLYENVEQIHPPGTLEGGDVMQVEDHFYIGLSKRTNMDGAKQLQTILKKYGYCATTVPLQNFFHLKTGIASLGQNTLVLAGEFINHPLFGSFHKIVVDSEEEYAANCVRVNDYVLIAKGFARTKAKIEQAGYMVIELEMSEFQKQDGGLSCLSLRF